jgi:hypothetical protein
MARGNNLAKVFRKVRILENAGGFLTDQKRNSTCHRIPRKGERESHCGYEPKKADSSDSDLDRESKDNQEVAKRK